MDIMPVGFAKLGFGVDDYADLARNVGRILRMQDRWDSILNRANVELSDEVLAIAKGLPDSMCNDREFFGEAGLNYGLGIPVRGCFVTALSDYLLRNKGRIRVC